ncbi:MAG: hypothetical protein Q9212_003180 [Teloschistes hypoglaucus]
MNGKLTPDISWQDPPQQPEAARVSSGARRKQAAGPSTHRCEALVQNDDTQIRWLL